MALASTRLIYKKDNTHIKHTGDHTNHPHPHPHPENVFRCIDVFNVFVYYILSSFRR